ncbi:MAG: hypothetical protein EBY16_02990, partial [Gammaproteobacteria bacterium]|nr:hypothetical protein [Gammaproteobacteria bacterium]
MKTSLQPLVFEKRRPDRGISFRKAINGADASNPTQPKFSPDFESTAPSKWKEFLGGFNHALGGLPPVNPTTKKGLVSESDKLEGPIKYIEDAKSSFGVDLSYFYHWGVAQSRYHRAQLINGDFRNPALKGMQSNAGKITDVMQRRAAELRSGLSADPNSNEYKKAMVTLNDLDKHDHYVGTLRVLQAYRKLRQGVPSGEIYSPDHWNADDYDGEKDYRDHPWLQHQSLSTWQQDDPLFVYAKKFLTKPETIARGSSKTAEDGDIRGYSKISVPNFNPVTPFITNQSDADAWSDHGQYFYQKEVRVPQQPPAFENLITDSSLNFESIKNLINDEKFSKGSFAKKIELAKIAADRYAEQCWAHYSGKLDLTKHSWFQRLKELGLNVNLSNVSAIDSLDSLETINPNELVFHKLARQLVENHQQDF